MERNLAFENAILNTFKDVITDFNFTVENKSKNFPQLQFYNDKCIIRFIYDMGSVECSFIDPIKKKEKENLKRPDGFPTPIPYYPVYSVWRFLYPNDKVNYSYSEWIIVGQVEAEKKLLSERLTHILNGDFSWTNAYKVNDDRITRKIEYMMTHWANPVRVRFEKGNPDWEKEFDEYKAYLDNLQK